MPADRRMIVVKLAHNGYPAWGSSVFRLRNQPSQHAYSVVNRNNPDGHVRFREIECPVILYRAVRKVSHAF